MGYIGNAPYQGVVDSGNILDGSIQSVDIANSAITSSKLASEVTTLISQGGGPKITNIQVTNNTYTVLDDTAVDTAGGYIRITGTGFAAGCQVLVNNVPATSTTFVSATEVRAQVPATAAGTYVVYLVNSDGGVAIRINGITFSATPTWTTSSSLGGTNNIAISIQLQATLAATYALAAGSTLPTGLTLTSGGLLSGTITGLTQETVYSFTVVATDSENQDSPRTFTLTITIGDPYYELVTLHLPGNGTNLKNNNEFLDSSTANSGTGWTITRNPATGPNAPTQGTFSPFSQTGWGNYFNGSSYLSLADNAAFYTGSNNFTVEAWVFASSSSENYAQLCGQRDSVGNASTDSPFGLFKNNTGAELNFSYFNGTTNVSATPTKSVFDNTWHHIALVRNGTDFRLYVDGISSASLTLSAGFTFSNSTTIFSIGRAGAYNGQYLTGYVSNFRFVNGVAVYSGTSTTTANFIVPTSPLAATQSAGTNIAAITTGQTVLLTCQSNRFVDNGQGNTGNTGFTITVNGSPSVQAFSPFNPSASWSATTNGGSGYFDGTGDYLNTPGNVAFQIGTGNFTIEYWVYPTSGTNNGMFQQSDTAGGLKNGFTNSIAANIYVNNSMSLYLNNTTYSSSNNQLPYNAWTHIAIVRASNVSKLYVNGLLDTALGTGGSITDNTNYSGTYFAVGGYYSAGYLLNGYISNFRVLKGTALYTSNFTPPTAPLTNITNTSLLLNFTNGGIYDATSKNDLETVGNAQISTTQSKWGGSSVSFDGTGDYLDTAGSSLNVLGSGDWTIEFWLYLNSLSGTNIIDYRSASVLSNTLTINYSSGIQVYVNNSTTAIQGSALSTSTWYHVAVSKSGSSTKMFVNGTQAGSTYSDTNNYVAGANRPRIGAGGDSPSNYLNGYIDDLRITKGYARYTSNFTAPTAAFPTL